ncbi:MAG: hypothetical protein CM15mP87_04590 [Candidatus Neomarinimicrobiota bacterium]|nr:MAG: hypothetical protein CM15mP87_04590 [Candidatus Neomarinimicrobiota bacterium]
MAVSREDVLTYLEQSNMMEISELISDIEEKFGVTAAAPSGSRSSACSRW